MKKWDPDDIITLVIILACSILFLHWFW